MNRVTRRKLVVFLGAGLLVPPWVAAAQDGKKVLRLGFLGSENAAGYAKQIEAMRLGLREYGFIEGKNLATEHAWADGRQERLRELADDLVRRKVDILIAHGGPGTRAAKAATTQIPIVIATIGTDPAETGLVASLARPGGNITGRASMSMHLHVKQMELIKDILPQARRITLLYAGGRDEATPKAMGDAARTLKLEVNVFRLVGEAGLDAAFAAMAKNRADAIVVANQAEFITRSAHLAELAIKHRVPLVGNQEFAAAGALVGYGASILDNFRRVGYFVDRIARGANPATMPIEQPTTFELVVNLKTAKALGITLPPSVMVRAERVIQ